MSTPKGPGATAKLARRPRNTAQRRTRLLEALETRLEALTEALLGAQLAEKGIDMMKEIKELHGMLESLQGDGGRASRPADAPRFTVVWGGMPAGEKSQDATVAVSSGGEPADAVHASPIQDAK